MIITLRLHIVSLIVAAVLISACSKENPEPQQTGEAVTWEVAYTKTNLNVRVGPGQNYEVVGTLKPMQAVYILERTSDKYVRIIDDNDVEGYVALAYLDNFGTIVTYSVDDGSSIMCAEDDPGFEGNRYVEEGNSFKAKISGVCGKWVRALTDMGHRVWIIMGVLIALDILLVWLFRKRYNYQFLLDSPRRPALWQGSVATVVSFIAMLVAIIGVFSIREGASSSDLLYGCLIAATGAVSVAIPWRMSILGKYSYNSTFDALRYSVARKFGFCTWLVMLIPLSIFLFGAHSYLAYHIVPDDPGIKNDLLTVIMAVLALAVGYFALVYLWKIIVKYFLESIPNLLLEIFSMIIILSISFTCFHLVWVNLDFFNCLIGLLGVFLMTIFFMMNFIVSIIRYRCPNCHQIAGENVGVSDHGIKYTTNTRWENEDERNLPDYGLKRITDAQRLVRVTKAEHTWTEHQSCPYCGSNWDVNLSSGKREVDRKTIRQRWEGYR